MKYKKLEVTYLQFCVGAPSMGADWRVKVPYGGWLHQPLVEDKDTIVR